jgi:hypothetical protein
VWEDITAEVNVAEQVETDRKAKRAAFAAGKTMGKQTATLVASLALEGQRALVIAGAARLDLALERLLKRAMRPLAGGSDNLFDVDRPLGTFAAKIALAHRLNLINDDVEHALQLVRRIRNDFAHSEGSASLSEASHSNRLLELKRCCQSQSFDIFARQLHRLRKTIVFPEQVIVFAGTFGALVQAIEGAAYYMLPLVPRMQGRIAGR